VSNALRKAGYEYEIIVVDDGSKDKTRDKALQCAALDNHVKVVSHPRNMGKGAAIKTGLQHSTGELVAFIDSDLEIPPELLPPYLKALEKADIAIASKWHPKSKVKTTFTRKILSKCFYALTRLLIGVKVTDTQTGLKAFKREALEKIMKTQFVKRYAFDAELLAVANLLGYKIIELPVKLQLEEQFKPKEIFRMAKDLLGIAYRLKINKYYQRFLIGSIR
jgi:glycosyltransferase involved in cell wall biosynthesis